MLASLVSDVAIHSFGHLYSPNVRSDAAFTAYKSTPIRSYMASFAHFFRREKVSSRCHATLPLKGASGPGCHS